MMQYTQKPRAVTRSRPKRKRKALRVDKENKMPRNVVVEVCAYIHIHTHIHAYIHTHICIHTHILSQIAIMCLGQASSKEEGEETFD